MEEKFKALPDALISSAKMWLKAWTFIDADYSGGLSSQEYQDFVRCLNGSIPLAWEYVLKTAGHGLNMNFSDPIWGANFHPSAYLEDNFDLLQHSSKKNSLSDRIPIACMEVVGGQIVISHDLDPNVYVKGKAFGSLSGLLHQCSESLLKNSGLQLHDHLRRLKKVGHFEVVDTWYTGINYVFEGMNYHFALREDDVELADGG